MRALLLDHEQVGEVILEEGQQTEDKETEKEETQEERKAAAGEKEAMVEEEVEERTAVENLMPQLLPTEDQALTPKRKLPGTLIPNKRMRSRSPSSLFEDSYSSSESSSDEEEPFKKNKDLQAEIKGMREAIQRNTLALISLEQSVLTLASAMNAAAKT